jgi:hypothetical protein
MKTNGKLKNFIYKNSIYNYVQLYPHLSGPLYELSQEEFAKRIHKG